MTKLRPIPAGWTRQLKAGPRYHQAPKGTLYTHAETAQRVYRQGATWVLETPYAEFHGYRTARQAMNDATTAPTLRGRAPAPEAE